ncbi:hypothetical protein ER308_02530 [Egibacter rhizosphaerae]|uniref:Tripartite tricarboxylate transporter TctB family protein n=1 Tax=Egibacter rhizosphaerae TaxID=1670831 RepID=A0A411YBH3_9ACTN|nr:hypothetical protein [Egibacter rhizosphaerae]QBI18549.1 hypothetical protein ER308_02530 [Egibacter rhizosphaerae]
MDSPAAARTRALLSGALTVATGVLFVMALGFPEGSRAYAAATLGVLSLLLLGSTGQSVLEFRRVSQQSKRSSGRAYFRSVSPPFAVVSFLATWVIYPMILMGMGFITSTAIAIGVSSLAFARRLRGAVTSILVAVPLAVSLFVVLQVLLNVGVPRAQIDRLIENWAYGLLLG